MPSNDDRLGSLSPWTLLLCSWPPPPAVRALPRRTEKTGHGPNLDSSGRLEREQGRPFSNIAPPAHRKMLLGSFALHTRMIWACPGFGLSPYLSGQRWWSVATCTWDIVHRSRDAGTSKEVGRLPSLPTSRQEEPIRAQERGTRCIEKWIPRRWCGAAVDTEMDWTGTGLGWLPELNPVYPGCRVGMHCKRAGRPQNDLILATSVEASTASHGSKPCGWWFILEEEVPLFAVQAIIHVHHSS
ncbi:hypothetical protein B0T19DRAFT_399629 [Cercophora scortea]|uniref:Uncharacterized protein n=1 Tax=Cercophora scortea TaxID=314031 RepID=A0AAE0J0R5_9PEZI|nr:hypothetical protein B0T19DRAFT_399629 [Cercophora scortea]